MKKSKLFMNVTTLFAVLVSVVFISCGAWFGDGQSGNITIKLPHVSSLSRAISSDKIGGLKSATTSYRITVNGMTHEGAGGAFTFTLPVGMVAEITVECLNSSGNVIVRAKKMHTVTAGVNNVSINLSRDGDVVGTGGGPSAPQPVPGKVTYNGGTGASNVPSDTQTYETGNEVTLQTGEPTRAGYEFAGWTSNVELKYDDAGQEQTIPQGVEFVSGGSNVATSIKIANFKMPLGGVVLTAQWTPITYMIKFNNGGGSGSQADLQFTVEDNKALPTADEVTFTPPQGKTFKHWATQADGVSIELEFIILQIKGGNASSYVTGNNEITIYAVWEDRPDLTSTPVAGDIIMKDGTLKKASDTDINTADTIAVVYKVAGGKAWAVGKVLSSSGMAWAVDNAGGIRQSSAGWVKNITDLQESNYSDGSTGLRILRAAVSDADDANLATNYPAWDYACNYGIKQGLTSFQTGWYLPSKQELQEVYNNKDAIEAALAKTGVSKTSFERSSCYWSSSQYASEDFGASHLSFDSGSWSVQYKDYDYYVCAVRQFTY